MKAQLLAYLKGLPLTVYLVAGLIAAAGGWLAINNAHQRELGRIEVEQKTARLASDSALKVLAARNAGLDSLLVVANTAAARNQAAKHASDVQAGRLKTARDSLAQAVADSLATIESLRERATWMIAASDSAEAVHRQERITSDLALQASKRALTFAVDSVRAAGKDALDKMRSRAELAERITKARTTGWRAALLGRCGVIGGAGMVWAQGGVRVGPAVTVGCRILP